MRHYIRAQRNTLQALGKDANQVVSDVRPVETSRILRRLAALSDCVGTNLTES